MRRAAPALIACVLSIALAACARRAAAPADGGQPAARGEADATPPPADSPLAKVQTGMSERQVEEILGPPTEQNAYVTGKAFVPFYFGPDAARVGYFYKGVGRVIFAAGGPYSRTLRVQRVEYDPNETGRAP